MTNKKIIFLILIISLCSCSNDNSIPKPYAFPRIERTDTAMQTYETGKFSFLYSGEAKIENIPSEKASEIWFNITYPAYNATIHCSYIPVRNNIHPLLEDSYQLAFSHATKADGINQSILTTESSDKTSGILYDIKGSVAVPIQFFVTDSINNFFRGSLYYNQVVDPDSVAPVTNFLRADIVQLMESMKWKNNIQ